MRRLLWLRALSTGAITLGVLQGFQLLNFSTVFTNFITSVLNALVQLLFGINPFQFNPFGTGA
jgi:hypothetical protein